MVELEAKASATIDRKTVADFGEQWKFYPENDGYYGSAELLKDILGPLLSPDWIAGKTVAEIGSGTGRIVNMLLDLGAAEVTAIEPSSEGIEALHRHTQQRRDRVRVVQTTGDRLAFQDAFDMVASIGVLHHIVDPAPVVQRAYAALKPGGKMVIWLYAHEGNEFYLAVFGRLRKVTTKLPHRALQVIAEILNYCVAFYIFLCRFLPLPQRDYVQSIIGRFPWDTRRFVIYDQLNPEYARYYRQNEARHLLEDNGFVNVKFFHRHGYSWTVVGEKPAS